MRKAAEITTVAFDEVTRVGWNALQCASLRTQAMKLTRPGLSEWDIDAALEYHARREGGKGLAYPPVVAGGASANVLHYVANNRTLK